MEKRRRPIVLRSPPLPKKVGKEKLSSLNQEDKNTNDSKKKSNYSLAFIEIFSLTVGAGMLVLPKAMEPLNSPLMGIGLTLLAGSIILFSHYAILRASPDDMINMEKLKHRNDDVFVEIVHRRLDNCCCGFKFIFEVLRWFLLWICSMAYFKVITTYLNQWTNYDLKEQLKSASTSTIFQIDLHNSMLWLVMILLVAWALIVMKLICDDSNTPLGRLSNVFKKVKSIFLIMANLATTWVFFGIIFKFIRRIDLNTFWSDLVGSPQNMWEGHNWSHVILVYMGSILPILCISFFNHLGGTSNLYKYIRVNENKLGLIKNLVDFDMNNLHIRSVRGRYNCFPGDERDRCWWGFWKSRISFITLSQALFTFIYILFPAIALLGSRGSMEDNILIGLTNSNNGTVITTLQVCSGFGVFASLCFQYVPMLVRPVRYFLLKYAYGCCNPNKYFNLNGSLPKENLALSCTLDIVLTFLALVSCFSVAVFAPGNLDTYMGFAGSLGASLVMLVYSTLIYLISLMENVVGENPVRDNCDKLKRDENDLFGCIRSKRFIMRWNNSLKEHVLKHNIGKIFCSLFVIVMGLMIFVLGTWWNVKQLMETS
jgi:hypothetical protein